MPSIRLVTQVPGPKSKAIVARRAAATARGAAYLTELAIEYAHGPVVVDADGNRLLDFAGGIGVLAVGHRPESVVTALKEQADKLIHFCAIVGSYEPYVELAERLCEIAPVQGGPSAGGTQGDGAKGGGSKGGGLQGGAGSAGGAQGGGVQAGGAQGRAGSAGGLQAGGVKAVLLNSGAEAVETAVKIARSATGRPAVVVFEGGYHGRTNLTLAMTSKYGLFKKGFGPFAPEIYRVPFPNLYRRPVQMSEEEYVAEAVATLDRAMVAQVDPSAVAAVVVEPVQGEGGFIPAPAPFLRRIRELCDQHGMVMVADEVQSGMGRTGKMFAVEHFGVKPDLVTIAKSLGAGMPISAVVGRADLMDGPHPGGLGGTYSGNPLACVAALEAIEIIRAPGFLERAREVGDRMRSHLAPLEREFRQVGEVRGLGPMLALEMVRDEGKEPAPELVQRVTQEALRRGLVVIRCGLYGNCLRLLPPLDITDEVLDEGMEVLAGAVRVVLQEERAAVAP